MKTMLIAFGIALLLMFAILGWVQPCPVYYPVNEFDQDMLWVELEQVLWWEV